MPPTHNTRNWSRFIDRNTDLSRVYHEWKTPNSFSFSFSLTCRQERPRSTFYILYDDTAPRFLFTQLPDRPVYNLRSKIGRADAARRLTDNHTQVSSSSETSNTPRMSRHTLHQLARVRVADELATPPEAAILSADLIS